MFQEFLEKYALTDKKIAVGVSGGADSLGLLLMVHEELKPKGYRIVALTVDHGLRPSSADEAAYVKEIAERYGLEHHTLVWKGVKPAGGIEEAARVARYGLLEDWCEKNDVHYLMTAHHLYDQAETFLMRLYRGSGLDGLCGMKEVSKTGNIFILRPMLLTAPDVFQKFLRSKNIQWIEDESNEDENLLRVKMRKFLPLMEEKTGISPLMIAQTMERLHSSRSYFENKIQALVKNHFQKTGENVFACNYRFFCGLDCEIAYRLMCFLIRQIGGADYQPEAQKILRLIEKIKSDDFKAATLGHCQIKIFDSKLWLVREIKAGLTYAKKEWESYLKEHMELKRKKIPAVVKKNLLLSSTKNHI
ncbi:MAG: tRNA lysidine(34) synthetase TilS [Alphaproteobacteria bacterium]|nr:tRNA lysidine(34) synthetase TilS [Alphaproteobacteria bacterium]